MTINSYSDLWFETFLEQIPIAQTKHEIDFLQRNLPIDQFSNVLDICCGSGRHSIPLSELGYLVTGIDNNEHALQKAIERTDKVRFLQWDMRKLSEIEERYDAILNLWHSFGYFDHDTNMDILKQVYQLLGPSGRFVLDVYNKDFFIERQGARRTNKDGVEIQTTNRIIDKRLHTEIIYEGTTKERFDWEVFSHDGLCDIMRNIGFEVVLSCANYNEELPVSSENPRMQIVFIRK